MTQNSKVPGNDAVTVEGIKYGGDQLYSHTWFIKVLKSIWKSETLYEEWHENIISITRKETAQLIKNIEK